MFNYANCSLEDFWKHIASHLSGSNIEVTLVGGGVATIYSHGLYMSGDLDFVIGWGNNHKEIKAALGELGFHTKGRVFRREGCPFTMDFSSPPVDIGNDNDPEIKEDLIEGKAVKMLTPTECIKDRLHKSHYWKDEAAFQAAMVVAKTQTFSMNKVKEFSEKNKIIETFIKFESQYSNWKKNNE